jgi:feruloyl esterase
VLNRAIIAAILILGVSGAQAQPAATNGNNCADLAKLSLPSANIVSAQLVAAGAFTPATSDVMSQPENPIYRALPAFCRVVVLATPTADSAIPIEVWMPAKGWNGRFRGQGNGGFAGSISYLGMALAVLHGYATAGTDTGHSGSMADAIWALGHPEKVIDFGYRAIHEMTLKAKATVQAYYASPLQHSYFAACSDGGREALMEAQRFPADYDGIAAGAPANDFTHLTTNGLYNSQVLTVDPAAYIPSSKLPAIGAAVLAACDGADGVVDGVVNDPPRCHFQPATLLCKGEETDKCLTAQQAHTLELLYAGGHDAAGKPIFPGYVPGAEEGTGGWALWITGPAPAASAIFAIAHGYFADMVYEQPGWDYKKADVGEVLKAAIEKTGNALDATNADLRPFAARGSKLILYHGWNDPAISALSTIDYYNAVRATTGPKETDSFVRLFMVPGMQHCDGGPGATSFGQFGYIPAGLPDDAQHDLYLALEAWVEKGSAPQTLIATKYEEKTTPPHVLMTRPLCAYPLQAKYKGSGDNTDAANFTCAAPAK